jgi:hypothetical protein
MAGAREMIVFISYENTGSPEEIGRALIEALHLGSAALGVDLLTGACEVRFGYDPYLYNEAQAWLVSRSVLHDISLIG